MLYQITLRVSPHCNNWLTFYLRLSLIFLRCFPNKDSNNINLICRQFLTVQILSYNNRSYTVTGEIHLSSSKQLLTPFHFLLVSPKNGLSMKASTMMKILGEDWTGTQQKVNKQSIMVIIFVSLF